MVIGVIVMSVVRRVAGRHGDLTRVVFLHLCGFDDAGGLPRVDLQD